MTRETQVERLRTLFTYFAEDDAERVDRYLAHHNLTVEEVVQRISNWLTYFKSEGQHLVDSMGEDKLDGIDPALLAAAALITGLLN